MLIVRPARLDDLDAFIGLAKLAGPGFTSLAVSNADLEARLKKSVKSFKAKVTKPEDLIHLLMLEDSKTGEVVGISAVKSQVGANKPFFSFKSLNIVQSSRAAERHFDMGVLILVNEYSGTSEVGTLFVKSKMRGTGAGRLISQARYMFIAAQPERFSETIISELRGQVDASGYSPFWEALGRKFFKMDFAKADKIAAETDNQFITDLMPKYPIYTELLSDEAQVVIGKAHPDGIGARRFLENEGFRFEHCIDIFDAGPTMVVPRDQIRTVKESQVLEIRIVDALTRPHNGLISNNRIEDFRAVYSKLEFDGKTIMLKPKTVEALGVSNGQNVRVFLQ
ncbi:MAG: arginine N-succinyltransferase [Robiginitomaculum sp.]